MMVLCRRLLLGLLLAPAAAWADPPGGRGQERGGQGGGNQGGGNQGGGNHGGGKGRSADGGQGQGRGNRGGQGRPNLGEGERATIRTWLGANPGFAAQRLPPGMANRLAQGKGLPPGIARRPLPADLLHRLPAWPGHQYLAVGATIVLIEAATGIVRQILTDALLPR